MKNLILLLALISTGCATKVVRPDVVLPERQVPAEAYLECPTLDALKSGDFESVVMKLEEVSTKYNLCRSKHKQLAEYIKSVK